MEKKSNLILPAGNQVRVVYIQSGSKEIGEKFVEVGDNGMFARFCNSVGLNWLFHYFGTMDNMAKTLGEYLEKGSNSFIEAAINIHGLRVITIGQNSCMLALSCESAPASYVKHGTFCSTRPGWRETYCGSALIFSYERYTPQGLPSPVSKYAIGDCRLTVDDISELYSFDCPTNLSESGVKTASSESYVINSIGDVAPGMRRSIRMVSVTLPRYYFDTLIRLGEALKGEDTNFFSIPYDLTPTVVNIQIPDFAINALGDIYEKITISEGISPIEPKTASSEK